MADEAIYRCINDACARPAPRRVTFCPWCGTAQSRAGAREAAATVAGLAAAAAPPAVRHPDTTAAPRVDAASATPGAAQAGLAATPSATGFGHSSKGTGTQAPPRQEVPRQQTAPQEAAPQEVPRPPLAAHPPQRKPIQLRWWLVALVLLWGAWLVVKPSPKKIERQINAAIALAHECKAGEAQAELIALRKTRATPEQLQRLQQALNEEAAICTRRRQRAQAWTDTSGAIEAALAASGADKARARLQAFTKRWGEDDDTRALKNRIEDARREEAAHRTHPLAVPQEGALGSSAAGAVGYGDGRSQRAAAESARSLIQSAERDLDRGDYGAAADKMTLCLTMVDAGNRECRALKTQAEQEARIQ